MTNLCPIERASALVKGGHRFECEYCDAQADRLVVLHAGCNGQMHWTFACLVHERMAGSGLLRRFGLVRPFTDRPGFEMFVELLPKATCEKNGEHMTYQMAKDTFTDLWMLAALFLAVLFISIGVVWQLHHPPGWPYIAFGCLPGGYFVYRLVTSWRAAQSDQ